MSNQKKKKQDSAFAALLAAIILSFAPSPILGQTGATRYVYDDNGRLRAVISPNGEANVYEYDPAGNITAIRRNSVNTLEVLDFSPREGPPGTQVTILGTGFGAGVNAVSFNGVGATIVSANGPQVVVTVPSGATTGPISLNTQNGSINTSQPFVVRGVSVTPSLATVLTDQTIQFTATVFLSGNQGITWSVNGVRGGAPNLGLISAEGFYTSPKLLASQPSVTYHIRATSLADASIFGESEVTIKNREYFQPAFAQALLVRNGAVINPSQPVSSSLSIRNGSPINSTSFFSSGLAVRNGAPPSPAPAFSPALSIRNGGLPAATPIYGAALSVNNGGQPALTPIIGQVISVAIGPSISGIVPVQANRGGNVNITINGANLSGASSLTLVSISNNAIDANIIASNINVNGPGTSLTATLAIGTTAVLGRHVLIVTTPAGSSQMTDAGVNILEVIP